MSSANFDYDCIIIGGGPGGLVSALYLRRFRRSVLLINEGRSRASWIPRTHNLLGYYRGISGPQLLRRLYRQTQRLGTDYCRAQASVTRVPGLGQGFQVELGSHGMLRARKVVLATGVEDVHPEIDNTTELRRAGLFRYCSICDGFEYQRRKIAVLAKDDGGLQKALFLANWAPQMKVIVPESMNIAPIRLSQLESAGAKILRCTTMHMDRATNPKGLWICLDTQKPFFVDAAYIELGCNAKDSAFRKMRGLRRSKSNGLLLINQEQRTSIAGLFAVGDCVDVLGQISVAAGQAAVAATTIHNDLLSEDQSEASPRQDWLRLVA